MSKQVQAYIREINDISPELSKTIAQIPKISGEEKSRLVAKARDLLHEVTEIFDELELANNMSGGQYDNRVEEISDDIAQWKKQLQASISQVNYETSHNELLQGNTVLNTAITADDHRQRMEQSTKYLGKGSEHVIEMNRIAQETIEIGAQTMELLEEQGNQIDASRKRLRSMNETLDSAGKTMRKIGRTLITNKIFLGLAIVAVLIIIGIVVFIKLSLTFYHPSSPAPA